MLLAKFVLFTFCVIYFVALYSNKMCFVGFND